MGQLRFDGTKHLSMREMYKLIEEEPEITVKGYLLFIREILEIEKSTQSDE